MHPTKQFSHSASSLADNEQTLQKKNEKHNSINLKNWTYKTQQAAISYMPLATLGSQEIRKTYSTAPNKSTHAGSLHLHVTKLIFVTVIITIIKNTTNSRTRCFTLWHCNSKCKLSTSAASQLKRKKVQVKMIAKLEWCLEDDRVNTQLQMQLLNFSLYLGKNRQQSLVMLTSFCISMCALKQQHNLIQFAVENQALQCNTWQQIRESITNITVQITVSKNNHSNK